MEGWVDSVCTSVLCVLEPRMLGVVEVAVL